MSAMNKFDEIRPKILDAVNLELLNSLGVDHNREPRILLSGLHDKTVTCIVQVYYSSNNSFDSLRTDIIDAIREVLIDTDGFSDVGLFSHSRA